MEQEMQELQREVQKWKTRYNCAVDMLFPAQRKRLFIVIQRQETALLRPEEDDDDGFDS